MLTSHTWKSPSGSGELLLGSDLATPRRLLIVPPLFDEHNKLRHFLVETMRLLEDRQIAAALPDLPGTNESLTPLDAISLVDWQEHCAAAYLHHEASHVLAVRGGCLCAPDCERVTHLAPLSGTALLRGMIRAQLLADREAGLETSRDELLDKARAEGIVLAGYNLSARMITELEEAEPAQGAAILAQSELGGSALWLRAEPSHDHTQAEALARWLSEWMA